MICCAIVFIGIGVCQAANNRIKFNPTVRKQQITMIGGDIERCQGFMASASNLDEIVKWGFVDLPFNVCRVSYDKKQEMTEGVKNYKFYDTAIQSMQKIRELRPDMQFWATMKSDYSGYNKSNNLPDWICDDRPNTRFDCKKYAVFLADYLELMEQNGVEIEYLSTAKEWTQTVTATRARQIITYLNDECARRNIKQPKYIDAATWSVAQGERYVSSVTKLGMADLYFGMATHNYGNDGKYDYHRFVELSTAIGLPTYADESSFGSGGRKYGNDPETISAPMRTYRDRCAFYEAGMVGEVMFEIFSRGVDPESRAIYIPSKGDKVGFPLRIYYIAKQHVNSIGGKYYTPYDTSQLKSRYKNKIYTMAFTSDDELYICVLNDGDNSALGLELEIEDVVCGESALHTYFTAELPRTGASDNVSVVDGVVKIDVLSRSINFINIPLK